MRSDVFVPIQGAAASIGIGVSGWPLRPALFTVGAVAGILAGLCVGVKHHRPAPGVYVCTRVAMPMDAEDAIVAFCRAGRPAEALEIANARLKALNAPTNAESRPALHRLELGRIHFLRGGALRLLGRESEARADYAQAADLAGDSIPGEQRADLLAQSGNWNAACESASKVISDNPDDAVGVNNACWELALCPGGDVERAVYLMEPIAEGSDDPYVIDTYAWSLYRKGDIHDAIAQEEQAVQAAKASGADSPEFYEACLQGMQGDRQEAIRELHQLFQENIRQPDAWSAAQAFAGDNR